MGGRRQDRESGGPYVGPADEITAPVLEVPERRVLGHLVGEIDAQGVFKQDEAGVNRAVVPSKRLVGGKVEDPSLYPVLGFLHQCIDVSIADLVEPALAIRLGVFIQTGSKSGRRQVIDMARR